ncbi:MAG: hypothetical protein KDN18_22135 [Verrucomicrobiae bacterium]|nr:hypothetical protein [Verrucomicrobiae bacterium]
MNRFHLSGFLALISFSLLGCTSNSDRFSVDGVPGWIADGARLEAEPEPRRPDAAIIAHEDESGPVSFHLITDKRRYEEPKVKKTSKASTSDPLERGRDARIRRLVR